MSLLILYILNNTPAVYILDSIKCLLFCTTNYIIVGFLLLVLNYRSEAQTIDTLQAFQNLESAIKLFEENKFDSAQNFYQKAAKNYHKYKIWNRYAESMIGVANCHYELGHTKLAISTHKKTIAETPTSSRNFSTVIDKAYNGLGFCYSRLGQNAKAHIYARKALEIQLFDLGQNHIATAETIICIGYFFAQQGEIDSALHYHKKGLQILQKLLEKNDPKLANIFINIGYDYGKKGDYEQQNHYYEKALTINLSNYGENHPSTATNYNNLGVSSGRLGNLEKKELYFRKALALKTKIYGKQHPEVSRVLKNLSVLIAQKGNFDEALKLNNRALDINIGHFGKSHSSIALNYYHIGTIYKRMNEHRQAIEYLKMSEKIYIDLYGDMSGSLSNVYLYLASCYQQLREINNQKKYLFLALKVALHGRGNKHPVTAGIYKNIAGYYFYENPNFDLALEYLQKAIIALTPGFSNLNPLINPEISDIRFRPMYLDILSRKAQTLERKYLNTQDTTFLKASLRTNQFGIEIADRLRFNINSDINKQLITEKTHPIYENAIRLNTKDYINSGSINSFDKAFEFSERSKAFLLRQELQDNKAKKYAHIPDSLVELDTQLKVDIAFYKNQIAKFSRKKDTLNIEKYSEYLFNRQQQFDDFIVQLEQRYPEYYALKYDLTTSSREDIQNSLEPNELFLEFFIGQSDIYSFAIDKNQFRVFSKPKTKNFVENIKSLRKSVANHSFITDSVSIADEMYINSASYLYNILFSDVIKSIGANFEYITIVPDGRLGLINFEALLVTKPETPDKIDYRKLDYLINHYTIGITPSATVLFQSKNRKKSNKKHVGSVYAGFAPVYGEGDLKGTPLENLGIAGTTKEIQTVSNIFQGSIYMDTLATESIFKDVSGDYQLLHLAMHGTISDNSKEVKLIFSREKDTKNDGFLRIPEIYNLNLNADMIILSSCNSGFGKIQKGEGVLSLSRAFMYSGSKAVIMSLWALPDIVAPNLIGDFSKKLIQGQTKDGALKYAKINYINSVEDKFYAHPYFWAGLVPIGEMSAFNTAHNGISEMLVGLGMLLLLVFIIGLKRGM